MFRRRRPETAARTPGVVCLQSSLENRDTETRPLIPSAASRTVANHSAGPPGCGRMPEPIDQRACELPVALRPIRNTARPESRGRAHIDRASRSRISTVGVVPHAGSARDTRSSRARRRTGARHTARGARPGRCRAQTSARVTAVPSRTAPPPQPLQRQYAENGSFHVVTSVGLTVAENLRAGSASPETCCPPVGYEGRLTVSTEELRNRGR